jgi:hypothetical protein
MTLLYPRERVIDCMLDGASHLFVLEAIILVPYLSSCALDRFRLTGRAPAGTGPPSEYPRQGQLCCDWKVGWPRGWAPLSVFHGVASAAIGPSAESRTADWPLSTVLSVLQCFSQLPFQRLQRNASDFHLPVLEVSARLFRSLLPACLSCAPTHEH